MAIATYQDLCIDAVDADSSPWTVMEDVEGGSSYLEPVPEAPFESLVFVGVPEPKTVKNRIHWDVTAPDVNELCAFVQ